MSFIADMPKVELHCHLDGSITIETMKKLAAKHNIELPQGDKELRRMLQVPGDCKSLAEYLKCFELPLACLKTEESFYLSTYHLLEAAANENVMYLELRFAPLLSVRENLGGGQIIESVLQGMKAAEKAFTIKSNLILCCMRHHSEEENLKVLELARRYHGQGVCGIDLAGDEAAYPAKLYAPIFQMAYTLDMPFTFHAGECNNAENVRDAVAFGARRLGHGIALQNEKELQKLCCERNIGIEMCPTSNLQTKAVRDITEYPIIEFINEGILVTVNTDNRTVSNTNMVSELELLKGVFDIDVFEITKNSIQTSFADGATKQWMQKKLELWRAD